MKGLLVSLLAAATARGQAPAAPGAVLSGIVREAGGAPLPQVTVSLVGEAASARTDSAGRFTLRDIPAGGHTALFRRIGYQSVEYRWIAQPGRELRVSVTMTRVRSLDRVVVEAPGVSHRRGTSSISGTVTDSAGRQLAGVEVRLLGAGLSTLTDSGGSFQFQMLAAGSYIVRVRREGLRPASAVMQILDDDNRGITLKLFGLPPRAGGVASASGFGVSDAGFDAFDRRARSSMAQPLLGPGDLFRANRVPLDILLQPYRDSPFARRGGSVPQGTGSTDDGDCLSIDGRRAVYQPLRTFTSLDVQLVEVFRANSLADSYLVSQMEVLRECRGDMNHHPSWFVLWTRGLR
jgi:hypothetical protein